MAGGLKPEPSELISICEGARYRADGDVLLPLAHVGALLQGGAAMLPEVPAAVGVPRLQAHPAGGRGVGALLEP